MELGESSQKEQLSSIRQISSEDVIYSVASIVILYHIFESFQESKS